MLSVETALTKAIPRVVEGSSPDIVGMTVILRRPVLAYPRFNKNPLRSALDKIALIGEKFASDETHLSYRRLRRSRSGRGSSRWHTHSSIDLTSSQETGICKKCHTSHQFQQQCGMINFTARLVTVTSFNVKKLVF